MMTRIKQIIDSCETYDQVKTCFSFAEQTRPGIGLQERSQILGWIRAKTNELRGQDLAEHQEEMSNLRQQRAEILAQD